MTYTLLAPVPCVHLLSALEGGDEDGCVAFGTNARTTFVDPKLDPEGTGAVGQRVEQGTPVLIYPSGPEKDNPGGLFKGPFVVAEAVFIRWCKADHRGLHAKGSCVRPATTLLQGVGDSPWDGFWEVELLKRCRKPVALASLRSLNTKARFKADFKPEHPMLIESPDL